MNTQELVAAIERGDYTAQLAARDRGAAVTPALAPLLTAPAPEVRELAVHCLVEANDPSSSGSLLLDVVDDRDPQVAAAAARGLATMATPRLVPVLVSALFRATEGEARRALALAIGAHGGAGTVPLLREQRDQDPDPRARDALLAALARLGDAEARESFAKALVGSEGLARGPWLELAETIEQPWLLGPLGELLDDETPVLRVGVDARPDLIRALRVCDLAIVLIAAIAPTLLSFPVTRAKNYTSAEIDEARRAVLAP